MLRENYEVTIHPVYATDPHLDPVMESWRRHKPYWLAGLQMNCSALYDNHPAITMFVHSSELGGSSNPFNKVAAKDVRRTEQATLRALSNHVFTTEQKDKMLHDSSTINATRMWYHNETRNQWICMQSGGILSECHYHGRVHWNKEERKWQTAKDQGYGGRSFMINAFIRHPDKEKHPDGWIFREVELRGPWHGGGPDGYTDTSYYNVDITKPANKQDSLGFYGKYVNNDYLISWAYEFLPEWRLCNVHDLKSNRTHTEWCPISDPMVHSVRRREATKGIDYSEMRKPVFLKTLPTTVHSLGYKDMILKLPKVKFPEDVDAG